jgi:O-antigen/teichoic acid export membrane protein
MAVESNTTSATVERPGANPFAWLQKTIVRESLWLAGGFASKLFIQMGTLYYLTHNLGVTGVGIFFALMGLFACLVPFVQLGNYDLTVRDIARREDPQLVMGRAMRSSGVGFLCLMPILFILHPLLAAQVRWIPYLMVAMSELGVMRVTGNVQAVATGFRLHYVTAVSDFVLGASRFAAVYIAARCHANVDTVLELYAFTTIPTTLVTYGWLVRRCGHPKWREGPLIAGLLDHLRMVAGWFAEMAAREGDKPLLNALSDARQTGIYGTATKLFGVMLVPIDVLTQVFRPRISQAYADGEARGRKVWLQMAFSLTGCGVLAGIMLFTAALLLPRVAPKLAHSEFGDARLALMYLAFVPPIYGLQRANIISAIARGAVGAYATATVVSAAVGVGTLVVFAPAHGWRAACFASQVYLSVSCLTSWLFVRIHLSRKMRADAGEGDIETRVLELELQPAT